jgi:hypothetical protein
MARYIAGFSRNARKLGRFGLQKHGQILPLPPRLFRQAGTVRSAKFPSGPPVLQSNTYGRPSDLTVQ